MGFELGIVCGRCDGFAPLGAAACPSCGQALGRAAPAAPPEGEATAHEGAKLQPFAPEPGAESSRTDERRSLSVPPPQPSKPAHLEPDPPVRPSGSMFDLPLRPRKRSGTDPILPEAAVPSRLDAAPTPAAAPKTHTTLDKLRTPAGIPIAGPAAHDGSRALEELMDQAKNFICRSCSTPVPVGHKFCGRCGAPVPPEILSARTQFFGALQAPGKAKLILIRGEGVEGLSYQLNAESHVVGRTGQLVFPDDPFVSPRHANFFYRDNKLVVKDEGSLNGVFIRLKGSTGLAAGDIFLAGEQVFKVEGAPKQADQPGPDGTYFYSSPKHQTTLRVSQILHGGAPGMVVCARGTSLQIGREGSELNFPADLYMSATHCKLEEAGGTFTLTDLNSRNGTYVLLKEERELNHGDYVFIGRKLLRVEITAA